MRLAGEKAEREEKCDTTLRGPYISGNKERKKKPGRLEGERRASRWQEKPAVLSAAERLGKMETQTHSSRLEGHLRPVREKAKW